MYFRFKTGDYLLDKINKISYGTDIINFYVDFKNGVYRPYSIQEFERLDRREAVSSVVKSTIIYVLKLLKYFRGKNRIRIIFYGETGTSNYHINIFPGYKDRRQSDSPFRKHLDTVDSVIHISAAVLENILNYFPCTYFLYGKNMDFDYMVYALHKDKVNEKCVIISEDKDNFQIFTHFDDAIIMDHGFKRLKNFEGDVGFLTKETAMYRFFKDLNIKPMHKEMFDDGLFTLTRAIVGDTSDRIKGVKGVGDKNIRKILPALLESKVLKPYDEMVDVLCAKDIVSDKERIFNDVEQPKKKRKKMLQNIIDSEEIIKRNMLLMDYNIMYRRAFSTNKQYIDKVFNEYEKLKTPKEILGFVKDIQFLLPRDKTAVFEATQKFFMRRKQC